MLSSNQPVKFSISVIPEYLLILAGVFASWGEELNKVFDFDVSKVYVALVAGLILCWLLLVKEKFVFPSYLNIFFLFVFIHTLITHGLIYRNEFTFVDPKSFIFANADPHVLAENYDRAEAIGINVLRQLIYTMSGYAFCATIRSKRQLFQFMLAYATGLSIVVYLGVFLSLGASTENRTAGGVSDPNAFGFSGAMALFLATIFMADKELKLRQKLVLLFVIILGSIVVLLSASRGAFLGVIIGLIVTLINSKNSLTTLINSKIHFKKIAFLVFALVFVIIIVFKVLASEEQKDSALFDEDRYSVEGSLSDHGAGRTDIWHDYVQWNAVKAFFFTGVGLGRTMEAIKDTYTYELKMPHNNYIGVFVDYGIIGIVLFCIAIVQIWKNIQVPAIRGLYTMWLITGFFLDNFAMRETWIILGIVCCCVAQKKVLPGSSCLANSSLAGDGGVAPRLRAIQGTQPAAVAHATLDMDSPSPRCVGPS